MTNALGLSFSQDTCKIHVSVSYNTSNLGVIFLHYLMVPCQLFGTIRIQMVFLSHWNILPLPIITSTGKMGWQRLMLYIKNSATITYTADAILTLMFKHGVQCFITQKTFALLSQSA